PLGRETTVDYYTNNIDVRRVRQTTGGMNETLAEFGTYNSAHLPASYTNAARQTYSLQWNAAGQLTQATDPLNEVTRLNYDTNGYLQNIQQDWAGGTKTNSFGYDGYGRVRTVTNSDNYALTYDYDALDRPTRITYPDSTSESYTYSRLDVTRVRDRVGRDTVLTYDNMGHPLTVTDRLGQITRFSWCGCGSLESITDPLNQVTTWFRDVAGRVTDRVYDDGKTMHYG